jgi:hypothetical protein
MGRVNIVGLGLALGALGQGLLIGPFHYKVLSWLVIATLAGPYLLVYPIPFCRVEPCGPGRFAQILVIAMVWYSIDTFVCELFWLLAPTGRTHDVPIAVIAHGLCYGSALGFIELRRAVRDARNFEANRLNSA